MPTVKVIVDSSAGIDPELATRWNVASVPFYVTFHHQTYLDGVDTLPRNFYALLDQWDTNPVTAAPNVSDLVAACRAALSEGYQQVILITASQAMSAVYANACLAAREIGEDTVAVLDTGQGAGGQALIAAYAAQLAIAGASLAEVLAGASAVCDSTQLFMAMDTLRFLRRSGRISAPQEFMGELIHLKPVLTFEQGRLQVIAKPRTQRRAVQFLVERVVDGGKSPEHILLMYADDSSAIAEMRERILERAPKVIIDASPVSSVVGGHTGPGLFGVAARYSNSMLASSP